MRIAIVGSGISGLVCAHLLHREHEITVFEANDYVGGHTNTVDVEHAGERHRIDTGFIVFNDRNYPNFTRLLEDLGVTSRPTTMSFSVQCDKSGLEYNGSTLNGLFAQRRNLLRPSFHRMIGEILRFNREGVKDVDSLGEDVTVGDYLELRRYSTDFASHYLLPMGAAIWSCPPQEFRQFPIRFILEFYQHHGLLQLRDRPVWRVIAGGSRQYVERLVAPFRDRIRLRCPVQAACRTDRGVLVHSRRQQGEPFDELILACHSDQALRILGDADSRETAVLRALPYGSNTAVLHTDRMVLPRRRRTWASWNYRVTDDVAQRPGVTYYMNSLQHIDSPHTYCVTLNNEERIDPNCVLGRFQYSHPVFTTRRRWAQSQHRHLMRRRFTSYCGAYWGNGFHEAGVNSAIAVCRAFGVRFASSGVADGRNREEVCPCA